MIFVKHSFRYLFSPLFKNLQWVSTDNERVWNPTASVCTLVLFPLSPLLRARVPAKLDFANSQTLLVPAKLDQANSQTLLSLPVYTLWYPATGLGFSPISLTQHPVCPPRYDWSVSSAIESSLMMPYSSERHDLSLFWPCNPWSLVALMVWTLQRGRDMSDPCLCLRVFLFRAHSKVVLDKDSLRCIGWEGW